MLIALSSLEMSYKFLIPITGFIDICRKSSFVIYFNILARATDESFLYNYLVS